MSAFRATAGGFLAMGGRAMKESSSSRSAALPAGRPEGGSSGGENERPSGMPSRTATSLGATTRPREEFCCGENDCIGAGRLCRGEEACFLGDEGCSGGGPMCPRWWLPE